VIVVLDTSVLIAAFVTTSGVCADVLKMSAREHELILSDYILDEYARKLRGKFGLSAAEAADERRELALTAALVEPLDVDPRICRDPADAAILGTALAAKADMLVTVDKDLLDITAKVGVDIVNPREFFRRTHS
jgi:putative PIN family toxin of toxin-antitoxin system